MQPLAIIEGMCSAKQIIVSNTKSLKATVGDYPANFVPVNDVVAISECLERLCREKIREGTQFLKKFNEAAIKCKKRFSKSRFDSDIKKIISYSK